MGNECSMCDTANTASIKNELRPLDYSELPDKTVNQAAPSSPNEKHKN